MAISTSEIQVDWGAGPSDSQSIASGSNDTSNAATLNGSAIGLQAHLKAANDGTPASGDTVDFYALFTGGDPDGASTDEYDTTGHGVFLGRIDTNTDDPGILSVGLDDLRNATGVKIYAENNSSGRAITVSALLREQTG